MGDDVNCAKLLGFTLRTALVHIALLLVQCHFRSFAYAAGNVFRPCTRWRFFTFLCEVRRDIARHIFSGNGIILGTY